MQDQYKQNPSDWLHQKVNTQKAGVNSKFISYSTLTVYVYASTAS